ncbi:MAG: glucose 1-dehydrogenase [Proteobacteria bacterium]|nr:glucose 1-dehydrogenase [Pseudomonadota bacterium]
MSGRVAGKIALVTGAGSGLGKAASEMLAREGASVVVTDIDVQSAQATAAAITESGGKALAIGHDVTMPEDWTTALERTQAEFGGLNILVNNAGVSIGGSIESLEFATWKKLHEIDLDSVFHGCKLALPMMRDTGNGSIVNLSSVSSLLARPRSIGYGTVKAGVAYLTKSVALYCAQEQYPVRCNSVHPAIADTPLLKRFFEDAGDEQTARADLAADNSLGKILEPDDVAYAILYLASDEARMVNGAELVIDGGMTAGRFARDVQKA